MKKSLLITLSVVSFFAMGFTASAQNLALNGDFEAALVGTTGTKIPNWLVDYGPDFVAVTNSNAITSQTIRINSKNVRYLTSDVINVTSGHTYKLTFTARVQDVAGDSGTGNPTGSITGIIMDGTVNGNLAGFTPLVVNSNTNTTLTGNYTAPLSGDGSSSVRLRFTRAANATGYVGFVDDVSFEDLGVLPISLISFTGNATNNGITLNWETASENNNKSFSLFNSSNGKDFTQIGKVNGSGNSIGRKTYSFIDKNPFNGVNYYKLTQTDLDGKTTSFETIGVNFDLKSTSGLSVYAEQTRLQAKINWAKNEPATVSVRDLSGRTVLVQKLNLQNGLNSFELKNADLMAASIYILTLRGSLNTVSTKFYIN
ncbi:T9SS type A sorting domain-containing protein [Pedobacter sp. SD-b]|uniref:T9SS type A sorting domain-containing protein n=1 Tax=Pedobacter segetis TaxID=2793069 RepID=A0ABS1BLY0_9SPHI|nr:T9SS type A sorting domain-containing protein [Pedobacter segetis]MBK0383894.1 T9SS type A sorting domain-containing protein [Pedobacter segetis]